MTERRKQRPCGSKSNYAQTKSICSPVWIQIHGKGKMAGLQKD